LAVTRGLVATYVILALLLYLSNSIAAAASVVQTSSIVTTPKYTPLIYDLSSLVSNNTLLCESKTLTRISHFSLYGHYVSFYDLV
jgi:hypothetical protein